MSKRTLAPEPGHGSVVLVHGATGTAYQKFYSDGMWHGTNGRVITWEEICTKPNPPLIIHWQCEEVTA